MCHDTRILAAQLRARLSSVVFPVSATAVVDLRARVGEYAAALRSAGVAPEVAIIAVKNVLRDAGLELTTHTPSTEAALTIRDRFCAAVVTWCIDGYYSDGNGSDANGAG